MFTLANAQKLHATLHDSFGSVAVTRHDTVGERPVVHADAHRRVVLLADVQKRDKPRLNLLDFVGILLIGVFQLLERARRIHIVAWIDAHLLSIKSRHISHVRIEMHVGDKRRRISFGTQTRVDILQILSFTTALCGQSHQFAARLDDALCLLDASLGIIGVGGGHRLDADRVVATHLDGTHIHHTGLAPLVIK